MPSQYSRIFQQPCSAILLILGFASGLPLALTSGTLQAWMTAENIDLKIIGFFSLVGQAYALRSLWSLLMDRYTPPFSGRRRDWLLATQILLLVAAAVMDSLESGTQLRWMAVLVVMIAFCSASQDIIFDAWETDVLSAEERDTGAAISVLGYRLGMLVSGDLALWLADKWLGWQGMYWLMAALLIPYIIATLLAPELTDTTPVPRTLEQVVAMPLRDFPGRNNAWLILLLIALCKLGDASAMGLTTTFLIRGVGLDTGEIDVVNKTLGLPAIIVGALYGGILMQRLSLFCALLIFGILQGASNAGHWLLSITDKHFYSMGTAVFFENLCGGMGTSASVALLIALCNKSFPAIQFALLSALSAVGRVYVGLAAGWFVEAHGRSTSYLFSVAAVVPGLILLLVCRQTLKYTRVDGNFTSRTEYPAGYVFAMQTLAAGIGLLVVRSLLLTTDALDSTHFSFLLALLEAGVLVVLSGVVPGGLSDYLALRKIHLT